MNKNLNHDEQALKLRDEGRSFVGIGAILEFESARAAYEAFNRALRGRPSAERALLRSREGARLDALVSRLRGRDDLSVEEVVHQLRALRRQRKVLLVA
jgi:hypothetical protein